MPRIHGRAPKSLLLVLLGVLALASTASMSAAQRTEKILDGISNTTLRKDWAFAGGYCGEMSIQQLSLRHGVWVSQQSARDLGGGELLLGVNLEGVVTKLGFTIASWDYTLSPTATNRARLLLWVKQALLADMGVIFGARLRGMADPDYDHIMPVYGVQYLTANTYDAHDVLIWSNDYGGEIRRAPLGPHSTFWSAQGNCTHDDVAGGCWSLTVGNYASRVGGLKDSNALLRRVRLVIEGWSDGSAAREEPLPSKAATAKYRLDAGASGIAHGAAFTVFRYDGRPPPANPLRLADLKAGPGLVKSKTFTMSSTVSAEMTHASLGTFASKSIVYFVAALGGV